MEQGKLTVAIYRLTVQFTEVQLGILSSLLQDLLHNEDMTYIENMIRNMAHNKVQIIEAVQDVYEEIKDQLTVEEIKTWKEIFERWAEVGAAILDIQRRRKLIAFEKTGATEVGNQIALSGLSGKNNYEA